MGSPDWRHMAANMAANMAAAERPSWFRDG